MKIDLIPKPEIIEGWVNCSDVVIYASIYPTKEEALSYAADNCVACIYIKYAVGEGLEK